MYPRCDSEAKYSRVENNIVFSIPILPEKIETFFSRAAKSENEIESVQGFTHCPNHPRIFLLDLYEFLALFTLSSCDFYDNFSTRISNVIKGS